MNKRQRIDEPFKFYDGGDDETHSPFVTWQDQSDFLTFRINQLCNTIEDIQAEHAAQLTQLLLMIKDIKTEHATQLAQLRRELQ